MIQWQKKKSYCSLFSVVCTVRTVFVSDVLPVPRHRENLQYGGSSYSVFVILPLCSLSCRKLTHVKKYLKSPFTPSFKMSPLLIICFHGSACDVITFKFADTAAAEVTYLEAFKACVELCSHKIYACFHFIYDINIHI
jgi:hypothetical protein